MGRKLLTGIALAGTMSLGALGVVGGSPAGADTGPNPLEFTRGIIQSSGLAPILCVGTPLAPTLQCAIYDPVTEAYFNPYTPDGSSPGILGLDSLLGLF